MSRAAELALAVALDTTVGEPPARVHPVVGMGRLATAMERWLPSPDARGAVAGGGMAWVVGLAASLLAARGVDRLPWWARGTVLWSLFAGRMLVTEVAAVDREVAAGDLGAARTRTGRLVSRPVDDLDAAGVRMAAVESLAENLSDSVVAPLACWAVAGLPGALAYRWVNTLDAQWGRRTPAWDRRGRVAARADDLANFVPARATALLLAPDVVLSRPAELARQARRTPSPNGGWPMAAMALALDVRLVKHGAYTLHEHGRDPDETTVPAARRRALVAGAVGATIAGSVAWWRERR